MVEYIKNKKEFDDVYSIYYEFEGNTGDVFYMSKSFAVKYGLENKSRLPLPDDYPQWVMLLKVICEVCFNSFNKSAE